LNKENFPFISIVITVRNVEKTIHKCITSLINQTYPHEKYEIIIVDGGSKDGTLRILKEFQAKYKKIKVIEAPNVTIGAGRNKGIKASKGDIIAITDGDIVVDTYWLENIANSFLTYEIGCVGGPIFTYNNCNRFAKYVGMLPEESLRLVDEGYVSHDLVYTRNIAYAKKALEEAGFFNEFLAAAEDPELNWRIERKGYKILFNPKMIVYHIHRSNIKDYIKQHIRNGIGDGQLLKLNRGIRKTPLRILYLTLFLLTIISLIMYNIHIFFKVLTILFIAFFIIICYWKAMMSYKISKSLVSLLVIPTLSAVGMVSWIIGVILGLLFKRIKYITCPK
jgi:glycosyltransferase involved in cell wall biosynthesis